MHCQAILFDMDGTLMDSSARIHRLWQAWSGRHDVPLEAILQVMAGRRAAETIRLVAPHLPVAEEVAWLEADELADMEGVVVYPGAAALLEQLPPARWAVVTSGAREVATARLRHVGLPVPAVFVTAEDVALGKPDPAGYLLAAARLDLPVEACVVVEDAPAGVAAGKAAGMRVVAVATTHTSAELDAADLIVSGIGALASKVDAAGIELRVSRETA